MALKGLQIFAIAAASFGAAHAHAEPAPAPQVAGVAADMSLDAARAAAPTIAWQNELSPHTGKPIAIWADAAFALEGQPYRVSLQPRPSGAALLRLTSDEHVDKAKTCRARVKALAAHFDAHFPQMKAPYSPLDTSRPAGATFTYNRLPGGAGYVSATPNFVDDGRDIDMIDAGKNAEIREVEYDDNGDVEWATGQRAKDDFPYALDLAASFYKGDEALPSTCHIEATVTRYPLDRQWPGRPSFEELDTAKNKLTQKPTMALLHNSLDGIELPPEGATLAYRCDVNRVDGRVLYCSPHERKYGDAKLERAARMRYAAMGFDPKGLDPDNDLPLRTTVTIKLLPGERLKAEALKDLVKPGAPGAAALTNAPVRISAAVGPVWSRSATSADLSRLYPVQALRLGIEARVVATCRIAEDLSLTCTSFEINPPEHRMFEDAAKRILALYRAAPRLKDGKDAVGTVVRLPILFKIADDSPPIAVSPVKP
jgi:hypothetical protein